MTQALIRTIRARRKVCASKKVLLNKDDLGGGGWSTVGTPLPLIHAFFFILKFQCGPVNCSVQDSIVRASVGNPHTPHSHPHTFLF